MRVTFSSRIMYRVLRRVHLRYLFRRVLDELGEEEEEALLDAFGQPVSEAALVEERRTADESDLSSLGGGSVGSTADDENNNIVDRDNEDEDEEDVVVDHLSNSDLLS